MDRKTLLSSIPKVDDILNQNQIVEILKEKPRILVLEAVRETLGSLRSHILNDDGFEASDFNLDMDRILQDIIDAVNGKSERHLRRVINGTGVVLHTNLGRAVLCEDAVQAVADSARNYSNLEYNLGDGERGSRYSHVEYIITKLTGAESAMVVNNNAAAVLLVLSSLCKGKEAVVSRGELVEIGGSFRIPEVMEQSGAILREVGATNRTHLYDYEKAITDNTGILLKVHTSNYRIIGFTQSVSRAELSGLGTSHGLPVVEDLGSGSLIDLSKYGAGYEPTVREVIKSGVDVVTVSGDKMLGGPQAGIIAGRKKYLDIMKKNPLLRALRVDKMTLAALEATLIKYLDEEDALKEIPTLKMMTETRESIGTRAEILMEMLKGSIYGRAEIKLIDDFSQVGGGAMPEENLPTCSLSIKPFNMSISLLEEKLRSSAPPIIARIQKENLILDLRTIREDEYSLIRDAFLKIL